MPVVQLFAASRLVMYFGDHLVPHVHLKLNDGRECTIEINTLKIVGNVQRREVREELDWIEKNRWFLLNEWSRLST